MCKTDENCTICKLNFCWILCKASMMSFEYYTVVWTLRRAEHHQISKKLGVSPIFVILNRIDGINVNTMEITGNCVM